MNRYARILNTLCAAVLFIALAPAASAVKLMKDVTLDWKPTKSVSESPIDVTALRGKKILVNVFTDARDNKRLIAENREEEDEGTLLPLTTSTDIPAWVGNHLADQLQQIGLTTVTVVGDADFVLDGTVEKFFVLETDNYRAAVSVHLKLTDKSGAVVWDTTLTANESRFGRSYKLENYAEVLSDAVVSLARAIANSPDFRSALNGRI